MSSKRCLFHLALCTVFWCNSVLILFAQSGVPSTEKPVVLTGLKAHAGFIIIHSQDVGSLANSYPAGLEINLAWQKRSEKSWEQCLCYPRVGLALSYWNFDKPAILGHGLTGMAYLEPVFGAWNRVSFSLRAAFGLSFQTNPYHEERNPLNQSYSTYAAFPLQLGVSGHLRLNKHWMADFTAVYNHISNGGLREPNKGINWPTLAIGVSRFGEPLDFIRRKKSNWRGTGGINDRFDLSLFTAFQEPVSKFYLFSPGIEVKYSTQVARISAITGGLEWFYDNGLRYLMEQNSINSSPHHFGIAAGHEFLLGKFIFNQQFGVYLQKPEGRKNDVYQRYGLMYRINRHLSGGINLKVHGHVANFIDFRVTKQIQIKPHR